MKWKNQFSSSHSLNEGGPQGGLMGILEYISQTDGNVDFLELEKRFKFIDDVSLLEIVNLISIGLSSYNSKQHVPSDVGDHNQFISSENLKSQS